MTIPHPIYDHLWIYSLAFPVSWLHKVTVTVMVFKRNFDLLEVLTCKWDPDVKVHGFYWQDYRCAHLISGNNYRTGLLLPGSLRTSKNPFVGNICNCIKAPKFQTARLHWLRHLSMPSVVSKYSAVDSHNFNLETQRSPFRCSFCNFIFRSVYSG